MVFWNSQLCEIKSLYFKITRYITFCWAICIGLLGTKDLLTNNFFTNTVECTGQRTRACVCVPVCVREWVSEWVSGHEATGSLRSGAFVMSSSHLNFQYVTWMIEQLYNFFTSLLQTYNNNSCKCTQRYQGSAWIPPVDPVFFFFFLIILYNRPLGLYFLRYLPLRWVRNNMRNILVQTVSQLALGFGSWGNKIRHLPGHVTYCKALLLFLKARFYEGNLLCGLRENHRLKRKTERAMSQSVLL